MNHKRQLVNAIINLTRDNIQQECQGLPEGEYELWDEYQGGVNWLDNEIGFFDDLYLAIDPHHVSHWSDDLNNVEDFGNALVHYGSSPYLQWLLIFTQKGGTNAHNVFEVRRQSNKEITFNYLRQK